MSLSNIGVVLFEEDQLREATTYYKESLAICRQTGDKRGLMRALHNLAVVQREIGQLAEARVGFEESLVTRAEIGDKRGQVVGRVELGMVLLEQGEIAAARTSQQEAIRLASETKLKPGDAQARYQLGEIALAAGDLATARQQHEQAMAMRRDMKEARTIVESGLALANIALEEGKAADAEQQAEAVAGSVESTTAPMRTAGSSSSREPARPRRRRRGVARSCAPQLSNGTERIALREAPDPRLTRLLQAWQQGDAPAGEQLVPLVYAELRRIARLKLGAERAGILSSQPHWCMKRGFD